MHFVLNSVYSSVTPLFALLLGRLHPSGRSVIPSKPGPCPSPPGLCWAVGCAGRERDRGTSPTSAAQAGPARQAHRCSRRLFSSARVPLRSACSGPSTRAGGGPLALCRIWPKEREGKEQCLSWWKENTDAANSWVLMWLRQSA